MGLSRIPALLLAVATVSATPVSADPVSADPVVASATDRAKLWSPQVREQAARLGAFPARRGQDVVQAIDSLRTDPTLDAVMVDATVFAYVEALRRGPAERVPDEVLDRLVAWRPLAVRHHDESAAFTVPLFDVASAAQGLRNEMRFRQGADAMRADPQSTLEVLVSAGAERDAPWTRGAYSAVTELGVDSAKRVSRKVSVLARDDDADRLAARLAVSGKDVEALLDLVPRAGAAEVLAVLRQTSGWGTRDAYRIALAALGHEDAGVRSVAMAHARRMAESDAALATDWQRHLQVLLLDPEAGATAALQLAEAPEAAIEALRDAAASDERLRQRLQLVDRLRNSRPELPRDGGQP